MTVRRSSTLRHVNWGRGLRGQSREDLYIVVLGGRIAHNRMRFFNDDEVRCRWSSIVNTRSWGLQVGGKVARVGHWRLNAKDQGVACMEEDSFRAHPAMHKHLSSRTPTRTPTPAPLAAAASGQFLYIYILYILSLIIFLLS